MATLFVILFTIFAVVAGIFYYVTGNIIFTAIYAGTAGILAFYISFYSYKAYQKKRFLFGECLIFMEKYIIALNTRKSLTNAFEDTYQFLTKDKVDQLSDQSTNFHDKIEYLAKTYRFEIFKLFKELILSYEITGGNILDSTEQLLKEISTLKSDQKYYRNQGLKGLISFGITWIFSISVVVISKFALKSFVSAATQDFMYQLLVFIGFLALLFSIFIYVYKMFSLSYIKVINDEKV